MESFEESNASKDNMLELPSINDSTTDEEDLKTTIKPRLSPLPRRRNSVSSDDGDLEPPPTVARKVSFADAFGFDLVSVKEFDTWEIPTVIPNLVMESVKIEEFYFTPSFILPSVGGIMERLHAKKVTLESVDFIPGTTCMKGIIRVLNFCFEKQVYVRMSLDNWKSFYDLLAEYVPDSYNGETDQFFFTISLVSPYQKEGARVDFCICYETPVGAFWDNNDGHNYVLTCHKKEENVEIDKQSNEVIDKNKKSCLKPSLSKDEDSDVFEEEKPASMEKYIPRITCSHDDFPEDNNDEETEDKSKEKNNEDESDVQLFLSQRLMNARITSSEENYSSGFSEKAISPNEQQLEGLKYLKNTYSGISAYNKQQEEECDDIGEYLPGTEVIPSKETKDFISLLSSDHNSGLYESRKELTKTQECLDGIEETNLYFHGSELKGQEIISPVIIDEVKQEEPCQWSSTEEQNEDSLSDSCLQISESPCILQAETTQFTEIAEVLDDNANPNYSQSIVMLPYFLTQNTKGIKDEQSLKSRSETIENDTLLPATTEHTGQEHLMLFSQQEDFQSISYECKSSGNVLEKENTEPNEKVCSFTSSSDVYLFREGQVRNIRDNEAMESTNLSPSLCKDIKHEDDVTKLSNDKQYISAGKEKELSDITPASSSKQYYVTDHDSHSDQVQQKIQATEKNVVSETGDLIDRAVHAVYDLEKESPMLDCSPSFTATENVTQSTFHEWHAMGSLPREQTQGNKVIIAKITVEKGQSQTSSQDRPGSKGSYMDIGDTENVRAQQEIDEKSAQKVTFVSGKNIELIYENIVSNNKVSHLSTEHVHYGGAADISREQYESQQYDTRLTHIDEENLVEHDVPVTQSSNGFTALGQDLEVGSNHDIAAEKETLDFTDASHVIITGDTENIDNAHANVQEGYVGPSILISEPDDERDDQCLEVEDGKLEDTQNYHHDDTACPDQQIQTGTMATGPMTMSQVSSKVFCFIMFVVFAGLMYHFDFLVCFALYLFSLYWLYWEGGRNKNPVRKE
ncbi:protein phosphatase 1 regulatory subunit 3A [Bufo bufo]|uniref:protein phosphatase 1 regulatory subunit 3A n=1 Tax=Bufo bufo TaxID=8384 RepID=UPI001ABE8415|nr:protein phosphatase 1 regulatory subunit 3A [Bufo bufo]